MHTPAAPPSAARASTTAADLTAGLVVCLVALPLCLGIALASGAPLFSGIITGIVGGLVVAWLGGSALLVSGPAAGLAAIVLAAITDLGTFEAFLAACAIAGVMQIVMGLARWGKLGALFPSPVVNGMLAAIGVLLLLQQFPHAVGARLPGGAKGLALFLLPVRALPLAVAGATLVGAASLAVLLAWDRPAFARLRGRLPGPLVAVVLGTLLAESLAFSPSLALPAAARVDLPDMSAGLGSLLRLPDVGALARVDTWRVAVTLAIVASLETLLSMHATDRMDPLKRTSDADRELLGQGVGNLLAGLLGGIPMTGVIVRSAANVNAGGRTRLSAFVHGVLLAAAVFALPSLLERIPLAALAAVLLHTGWKLAHPTRFVEAVRLGRSYALPMIATVVAVVATDLLVGVFTGLAVAAVPALLDRGRHGLRVERGDPSRPRVLLPPSASFVVKPGLQKALAGLPQGAHVTIDGSATTSFDHDILEWLHGLRETASAHGHSYDLISVPAPRAAGGH